MLVRYYSGQRPLVRSPIEGQSKAHLASYMLCINHTDDSSSWANKYILAYLSVDCPN
ncbi:hypothetical protein BofuT4_P114610.1 [Botrytis cinerea T4]|uniref:Uncharacterized protein n=1 Tax=Botryotinia fuckeliana (strain T4) TaxID=999810 RepID=G2Y265_BOTF4|nr:hypothetical protein BofuT4_P114610.1 [Botrytis cinerea T4]